MNKIWVRYFYSNYEAEDMPSNYKLSSINFYQNILRNVKYKNI